MIHISRAERAPLRRPLFVGIFARSGSDHRAIVLTAGIRPRAANMAGGRFFSAAAFSAAARRTAAHLSARLYETAERALKARARARVRSRAAVSVKERARRV